VRAVPNVGFLLSCVTIGEGVIRIWRDWLAERAVLPPPNGKARLAPSLSRSSTSGGSAATAASEHAERMLWLDSSCNVGIRVRVVEREDLGTQILMRLDEDPQVAYSIEYEGSSLSLLSITSTAGVSPNLSSTDTKCSLQNS
jgi:hypothetical protein